MEHFIVILTSKPGHGDPIAEFYKAKEPALKKAKGYQGRKIYQARTGAMAEAVKKMYTAEELAQHAEPPHEDPGTLFVIVEHWDSIEDRMAFSKSGAGGSNQELIPHLLPAHSHEFFDEVKV